ncbi:hypothetical protein PNOK_0732200 [Pyrrhoderma noxium]|uniref:Uncharacterized protein n=1 Tax=Pyrrhoderma noxium TaxID=2282107 RepID=A0A286UCH7_9AGAM|nr:hypothetical protein PNOK_0732200 [Pyrrhoderma noxium]
MILDEVDIPHCIQPHTKIQRRSKSPHKFHLITPQIPSLYQWSRVGQFPGDFVYGLCSRGTQTLNPQIKECRSAFTVLTKAIVN